MADIGKRIREKRELAGITQEELAEKLGYKNKSTIAKIENGTNDIVQSKVIEFAGALNTTPSYLMGWEDKPQEQFQINKEEQEHLHRYRSIDKKGKHTVDTVLEMEYNRCNKLHLMPVAAHNDYAEDEEEQRLMQEDLDEL